MLTTNYKYYRSNGENLPLPINCNYFKNEKYFAAMQFLESKLNFEHFEKKNEPHSLSISSIIDSEKRGYLNA